MDKLDLKHRSITTLEEFSAAVRTGGDGQLEKYSKVVLLRNFLADDVFSQIAEALGPALTELYLGANTLTAVPDLRKFTHLKILHLNNNSITSLSGVSGGLQHLEQLDLRSNKIDSLQGFPDLPALTWLSLSCNSLTTLSGLPLCPQLSFLGLFGNYLGTDLPSLQDCLQTLSSTCPLLRKAFLSGNGWDDLPEYKAVVLGVLRLEVLDGIHCG